MYTWVLSWPYIIFKLSNNLRGFYVSIFWDVGTRLVGLIILRSVLRERGNFFIVEDCRVEFGLGCFKSILQLIKNYRLYQQCCATIVIWCFPSSSFLFIRSSGFSQLSLPSANFNSQLFMGSIQNDPTINTAHPWKNLMVP